ncbi:MAG TPA: NAD-dependent epimerase/dehydratase family protein [Rhizomicrobium sp.]|nr:NAD-dependent epimerase/dehydratase family protein [Rhizomicrobium sp.]
MRVFFTGATGFIGQHTLTALLAAGHTVTALSRMPRSGENVRWLTGAMSDDWREELAQCDALLHLASAGVTDSVSAEDAFSANVVAPIALLRQAIDAGCLTWTLCGSCFEYGREGERKTAISADCALAPVGTYSASKAAFSLMAMEHARKAGARARLMRPFQVYGEGEAPARLWASMRAAAVAGKDFPMTPGEQVRDFIAVEGVARALTEACLWNQNAPATEIWNVGTGRPQTLLEFSLFWWARWKAKGHLLPGALPYRDREVMRYVPSVDSLWSIHGTDGTVKAAATTDG